jgi:flagellar basal-body rod protein FlgB
MATELDNYLQFHAQALNLRAMRQQLLASNIANADTPGYQARDIDFGKSLQAALAGRAGGVSLARTADGHLGGAQSGQGAGSAQYRSVVQPSIDGNTVDMDVERAKFAENAIHYEANLTFINSQLKAMLAALQS